MAFMILLNLLKNINKNKKNKIAYIVKKVDNKYYKIMSYG